MKKFIISVLLILSMCMGSVSLAEGGLTLVVDQGEGTPGEQIEINFTIENNPEILGVEFDVEYDATRLGIVEAEDKNLLGSPTFSPYENNPFTMIWSSGASDNFTEDGVIATITFQVLENAPNGEAYINVIYEEGDVFAAMGEDFQDIHMEVVNGSITVTGGSDEPVATPTPVQTSKPSYGGGGGGGSSSSGKNNSSFASVTNTPKPVQNNSDKIILTIGKKEATVFGEKITNDVAPVVKNDRTMLPIRFIAEALGAKVGWNANEQIVTVTKDSTIIVITIGSDKALVNNKQVILDSVAYIENDRTYLPIRFVTENIGADVKWNDADKTVTITKK